MDVQSNQPVYVVHVAKRFSSYPLLSAHTLGSRSMFILAFQGNEKGAQAMRKPLMSPQTCMVVFVSIL